MIRAAEAVGNIEAAQEWEARGASFRAARHRRRMDLLAAPIHLARGTAIATLPGTGTLLAIGIVMAVAEHQVRDVLVPITGAVDTVAWICAVIAVLWGPALAAAPFVALAALWAVGRRHGAAPAWMLPGGKPSNEGAPITPSIVVTALRDLGVAPLRNAIREMGDAGAAMLGPITMAGCGVEVDVHLPSGSPTEEVMNRRRKMAENLGRHEHELYISVAPAARTVRLWIADSGALDEPVPASPLVTDPTMTANYKTGRAPWGLDLRGDAATLSLFQKHVLVTGLSNQGKTASLRALALWLALDPTVDFRLGDLKGVGDWSMFEGLASVLIEGPTDDHVVLVTEMVEEVFIEMQRRLMAPKGTVFTPLVVIVDEAQVAYGSAAVGLDKRPFGGAKATSRYFQAVKGIHDQGRAVNVTIWEGTQDPTDQNLPKRSREGNHIRAALVLGTESQARMALGESPVEAGAAPHKLRQGLDKGQLVVAGDGVQLPPAQVSLNVRTHYINDEEAVQITNRAKALRSGVTTRAAVEPAAPVDHLSAIAAVIGNEPRMGTDEVRQHLAQRNPTEYRSWTASDLKQALEPFGAAPYKSNGNMVVSRDRVLEALAERAAEDDGDEF
ncbi:S-DNA-T family DNA segregation ATPase FtsK/SpoIIIE [Streptacidiphilus sp. MAP12-16]|uniref:ATP-binding protein n=1 Tax=Streptacidiphilus sp. MAP12-16 TaxID=3156300 RepID=UPI0035147593